MFNDPLGECRSIPQRLPPSRLVIFWLLTVLAMFCLSIFRLVMFLPIPVMFQLLLVMFLLLVMLLPVLLALLVRFLCVPFLIPTPQTPKPPTPLPFPPPGGGGLGGFSLMRCRIVTTRRKCIKACPCNTARNQGILCLGSAQKV